MSNDYIGDLKDFKDYDFGIYYFDECAWAYKWKWGKASSEDYEQFLKDTWGGDDDYNINWYNVCFADYSTVCDDHLKKNFNYVVYGVLVGWSGSVQFGSVRFSQVESCKALLQH